jgi:DNA ligase (NAD+)
MDKQEAKKEIEHLSREIDRHNELYYQQSSSVISDFDFDQLLNRLIALENEFPEHKAPDSSSSSLPYALSKQYLL